LAEIKVRGKLELISCSNHVVKELKIDAQKIVCILLDEFEQED